MKVYTYILGAMIVSMVVYGIDRNGYNRCKNQQAVAVAAQQVADAEALTKIQEIAHAREKVRIKYIDRVQKITTPCAVDPVPVERADGVREFYRSQTQR